MKLGLVWLRGDEYDDGDPYPGYSREIASHWLNAIRSSWQSIPVLRAGRSWLLVDKDGELTGLAWLEDS